MTTCLDDSSSTIFFKSMLVRKLHDNSRSRSNRSSCTLNIRTMIFNEHKDKNEPVNSLYKALPPEMIHPWKSNLSEIRVFDVKARNLDEHIEFMSRHTGQKDRFLDVKVTLSHPVRLTFSSREHIAQYLINYISRGKTYSEIRANCQTFAADFCAFLAGKKDVQPYHPINRVQYHNQSHYFLYDPSMYHH